MKKRFQLVALLLLFLTVTLLVYRRSSRPVFEEAKASDTSAPPPKGAPLEIALVYPSGQDFADPDKVLRYRMDRSDEWCAKVPTRKPWRREGRTIWLYAADGIARGTAGKPETSSGADGRSTECYVDSEVRDVRSKRAYFFAAPHGHARLLPNPREKIERGECRGEIEALIDLNADGRVTAIVAMPTGNSEPLRVFCESAKGVWKRL